MEYHDEVARAWLKSYDEEYRKVYYVDPQQSLTADLARVEAVYVLLPRLCVPMVHACCAPCRKECVQDGSKYYFSIDSVAMVTNPDTIQHLLKIDKYVICVVL